MVIAKSLTLHHALVSQLPGLDSELQSVASYEAELAHLRDAGKRSAAVMFGWPEYALSISDELLVTLRIGAD